MTPNSSLARCDRSLTEQFPTMNLCERYARMRGDVNSESSDHVSENGRQDDKLQHEEHRGTMRTPRGEGKFGKVRRSPLIFCPQ